MVAFPADVQRTGLLEPPAHSADPLAYASSHQAFLGSLVWLLSKLLKQHVFHLV